MSDFFSIWDNCGPCKSPSKNNVLKKLINKHEANFLEMTKKF